MYLCFRSINQCIDNLSIKKIYQSLFLISTSANINFFVVIFILILFPLQNICLYLSWLRYYMDKYRTISYSLSISYIIETHRKTILYKQTNSNQYHKVPLLKTIDIKMYLTTDRQLVSSRWIDLSWDRQIHAGVWRINTYNQIIEV